MKKSGVLSYFFAVAFLAAFCISAHAQWNYLGSRWADTKRPLVVQLGSNVDRTWQPLIGTASINWSKADTLDMTVVAGRTTPAQCGITLGRVEVCNAKYGQTGWYGITAFTTDNGYISGASVKLNDSYRMTKEYRTMIACHEIGHSLGLAHQDTTFGNTNVGTCLDYTFNPAGNMQPNNVDYTTLHNIYSTTDFVSTLVAPAAAMAPNSLKSPKQWGKLIHASKDGSELVFSKDFGFRKTLYVFVTRVPGEQIRDEDEFPQLTE